MYLGLEVLRSLDLFAPSVATLLSGHPTAFLYGSVAADIPVGKRYAPEERHPHTWAVGWEMYRQAGGDPCLRATALGYLCHLAADVAAHESFVPRMLLLTASTRGVGHSYWEHRMDVEVGGEHLRLARSLVLELDHTRSDDLMDRVLARTLFSFETNRRIFQGVVRLMDHDRWHTLFDALVDVSRWELPSDQVDGQLRNAFALTAGFLRAWGGSEAARRDPTGRLALGRAKRIRRRILRREGLTAGGTLRTAADRFYPLPNLDDGLWGRRGETPGTAERARRTLAVAPRRKAG